MLLKNILLVGFGGALGSITRYIIQKYLSQAYPVFFPLGTFIVNLSGCFLIGILYGIANKYGYFTESFRLLLMVGFCGGFTTFSAFTVEGMELLDQQKFLIFTLYITLSVVLGLTATFMGVWLTQ